MNDIGTSQGAGQDSGRRRMQAFVSDERSMRTS